MRQIVLSAILAIGLSLGLGTAAQAEAPIPAPPTYYVLDEPGVLSPRTLRAIQDLLVEHDRLTQQQIVVAIFKSLQGEDLVDRTVKIFQAWGIGQSGKDNGALLAIFWDDHQARIEVGYGLEAVLTDARTKRILSDYLVPALRAGSPDQAISLATYQLLVAVDSPLVTSGRAEQVLRSGGFRGRTNEIPQGQPFRFSWIIWLVFGGFLFMIVFNLLSSADAHFTSAGWYRPKPWRRGRWDEDGVLPRSYRRGGGGWWGGGGGWGGGSSAGGGGFIGGGGRSGGGGASASW